MADKQGDDRGTNRMSKDSGGSGSTGTGTGSKSSKGSSKRQSQGTDGGDHIDEEISQDPRAESKKRRSTEDSKTGKVLPLLKQYPPLTQGTVNQRDGNEDVPDKIQDQEGGEGKKDEDLPLLLDVVQLPAEDNEGRPRRSSRKDRGSLPIAAKVLYLKRPAEPVKGPPEPEELLLLEQQQEQDPKIKEVKKKPVDKINFDVGLPTLLMTENIPKMFKDTEEDKLIDKKLTAMIEEHRGVLQQKLKKQEKAEYQNYSFGEMINMLKDQGVPCPTDEDFSRLHGLHSRWDPDGTVIEYFSPMLRTFIPINMRGRYRGCWTADDCIRGVDISKVPPKRDALEGFVQRGRHSNIQERYREMSPLAVDEQHLDYLIEIQAYQAETLPIPIFYDILHLGMEVANENLRILVQDDGYSPNDEIFLSTEDHAQQLRRKIQLYGALGLEKLESKRKGLGTYQASWLKTRDEVIRDVFTKKDNDRYEQFQRMEDESAARAKARKEASRLSTKANNISETNPGKPNFSKSSGKRTSPEAHVIGAQRKSMKPTQNKGKSMKRSE